MEIDKMKQWLDIAKQFQQGRFWEDVFEGDFTKQIMEQFAGQPDASPMPAAPPAETFPKADVLRTPRELIVLLDLPGVRKEDLELSVADGLLHIRGVSKLRYPELQPVLGERFKGEFERTLPLPEPIGPGAGMSARFDNGLLEIRLARKPVPRTSIRIE